MGREDFIKKIKYDPFQYPNGEEEFLLARELKELENQGKKTPNKRKVSLDGGSAFDAEEMLRIQEEEQII